MPQKCCKINVPKHSCQDTRDKTHVSKVPEEYDGSCLGGRDRAVTSIVFYLPQVPIVESDHVINLVADNILM